MAHALLGELSVANKLWCERFQDSDYLFRELINGRSIADKNGGQPLPPGIEK